MIVQQKSDDEEEDPEANPHSVTNQVNNLVDCLKSRVGSCEEVLRPDHVDNKITGSVCTIEFVPLGQQRLLTVELVYNMIQLKKDVLMR